MSTDVHPEGKTGDREVGLDGGMSDALVRSRRFFTKAEVSEDLRTLHRTGGRDAVAEEVFFRGALYSALDDRHAVLTSTAVYTLATVPTRNPALVLAAGAMGTLFAFQRRASGGIQAPALTHLTWSLMMLRFVPPLFRSAWKEPAAGTARLPKGARHG